jgi:hypothetical protein
MTGGVHVLLITYQRETRDAPTLRIMTDRSGGTTRLVVSRGAERREAALTPELERLLESLASTRISIAPGEESAPGGPEHTLTVQDEGRTARFHWMGGAPAGWEALGAATDALTKTAESLWSKLAPAPGPTPEPTVQRAPAP